MKKKPIQKKLILITLALCLAALLFTAADCGGKSELTEAQKEEINLIIADIEFLVSKAKVSDAQKEELQSRVAGLRANVNKKTAYAEKKALVDAEFNTVKELITAQEQLYAKQQAEAAEFESYLEQLEWLIYTAFISDRNKEILLGRVDKIREELASPSMTYDQKRAYLTEQILKIRADIASVTIYYW